MKRNVSLTKNGLPAMWESGGAMTNSADCTLVGDKFAQRKKPVFIRTGGHLSNDNHALFILNKGDVVVVGTRARSDYSYVILRFVSCEKLGDGKAIGEFDIVNHYSEGQWDNELDSQYNEILDAAKSKMGKYHCRSTVYALGLNVVADTLRDIKAGKMPKLNKVLSTTFEIIDEYFKCNKGKEREVLEQFDFSDFNGDALAAVVRYVPWQILRAYIPHYLKELYEAYRCTNYKYHFIIPKDGIADDTLREMLYNGVSLEEVDTRDFNELPDSKKIKEYLGRKVIYINFLNMPEDYSYASGDAIFFGMRTLGYGSPVLLYDHLSHIVDDYVKNPYSASCLITED